jgi:peptidyl-tRNA hydrolase, PTH1 family
MKLIVGLGNMGERYEKTRHNVGFMVVDSLAGKGKWKENKKMKGLYVKNKEMVLVKPLTYMNESGRAVSAFKNFYKIDLKDVSVVHDDLDLELGKYKIQKGVGPKVHNGVSSVEEQLGDKEFWRVRIGVDSRRGNRLSLGEDYVLGKFSKQEQKMIDEVMGKVVGELLGVLE